LERVRRDAKGVVLRFAEFDDRDEVRCLTNQKWFEARSDFPELADDEIYYADLIGMIARTEDGEEIGPIKDVVDVGPNSILVIRYQGREVMVPNVDAFVIRMNTEAGEVIIRPLDGLLDV
jgi:16S rRNA processing protein RimM